MEASKNAIVRSRFPHRSPQVRQLVSSGNSLALRDKGRQSCLGQACRGNVNPCAQTLTRGRAGSIGSDAIINLPFWAHITCTQHNRLACDRRCTVRRFQVLAGYRGWAMAPNGGCFSLAAVPWRYLGCRRLAGREAGLVGKRDLKNLRTPYYYYYYKGGK